MGDAEMTTGIALPGYSDPEEARGKAGQGIGEERFISTLCAQMKIQLLTTQHLLIPGGFLFDSPALWRLFKDPDLLNVIESNWGNDRHSCLVVAKHKVDSNDVDENFNIWLRGTAEFPRKSLNPSVLGTEWATHAPEEDAKGRLEMLLLSRDGIDFKDYVGRLELDAPIRTIEKLFQLPGIQTPLDRHAHYFNIVQENTATWDDGAAPGLADLRRLMERKREIAARDKHPPRLERGEIQKDCPETWKTLGTNLNHWRKDCYFSGWAGCLKSDFSGKDSCVKETQAATSKIMDRLKGELSDIVLDLPQVDALSFEHVRRMREDPNVRDAIVALDRSLSQNGDRYENHLKIMKHQWVPAIREASRQYVPEVPLKEFPYGTAIGFAGLALGAMGTGFLPVAVVCGLASLAFLGVGWYSNRPGDFKPVDLLCRHVERKAR